MVTVRCGGEGVGALSPLRGRTPEALGERRSAVTNKETWASVLSGQFSVFWECGVC